MNSKFIKLSFVLLFSAGLVLLLGSMPISEPAEPLPSEKELKKLEDAVETYLNLDISGVKQKNPQILLEFSVE